jgi:putative ATPase
MPDLFQKKIGVPSAPSSSALQPSSQPLADRMRPVSIEEYSGQEHLLSPGKLLRRAIDADRISSLLLYGPPGTGKTTLARIIATHSKACFEPFSGVENSVADLRRALQKATDRIASGGGSTLFFVDEIHRLNKAQQDVLLPALEQGTVRFIGATTHNPYFVLTSALVSRSQVFQLEPLSAAHLVALQERALNDTERGFGTLRIEASRQALEHFALHSEGDARKCLGALELAILSTTPDPNGCITLDITVAQDSIQRKAVVYDRSGDQHYDTISALIKSVRGGDPDAALYWLARMLVAGEDIRFLARRLVILASEDIGLADSNALSVAVAAQQAVELTGLPEAQIPLAHATVYLATAPKSNRAYTALIAARKDVEEGRSLAIPRALRDTHFKGAEAMGHTGYKYPHDFEGSFVPQAYLEEGRRYYHPTENGAERRVKERLDYWRTLYDQASEQAKISKK